VPVGFEIYLRASEPAPAGYAYVRSYVERLERDRPSRNQDERDEDERDKDERTREIVIRVYRKLP